MEDVVKNDATMDLRALLPQTNTSLEAASQPLGDTRFSALDSWRGLAALIVALYHINAPSHVASWKLISQGGVFIVFFFVLSGFVITCKYENRIDGIRALLRFMVLRFGRLYPLHFAILALFAIYYWVLLGTPLGAEEGGGFSLFISMLLLNGFGIQPGFGWNPPSWSISTEFYTYLCFAIVVLGYKFRKFSYMLIVVASLAALYQLPVADHHGLIFTCTSGFFIGAITWQLYKWLFECKQVHARLGFWGWTVLECLTLTALGYLLFCPERPFFVGYYLPAFLVFPVVLVFAFQKGALARMLKAAPFVFVGTLSYSVYLLHDFLIMATYGRFIEFGKYIGLRFGIDWLQKDGNIWAGDLYYVIFAFVLLVSAYATYTHIEKPWRLNFRNYANRI